MQERKQRGFFARIVRRIVWMITAYFAFLGFGVTLLGLLLGYFLYHQIKGPESGHLPSAEHRSVQTVERSILRIKLDRPIREATPSERTRFLSQLLSDRLPIAVRDLQLALRRAAEDIRIHGVLVEIEGTEASLATLTAVRRAMEQFRSSRKPLFVHLTEADSSLYYLASAGSTLSLAPVGGLSLPGPAFQLTYWGPALDKLGIQLEVVRAGRYKSAMEAFTQDRPSQETLEMYQALESSLRTAMVEAIAGGRGRGVDEVRGWLRRSLFTGQQALAQGLIDRVGYLAEWEEEIKTQAKAERFLALDDYLAASSDIDAVRLAQGKQTLGLIEASGEILLGEGSRSGGEAITPADLVEELRWAANAEDIKAVVMRVESPGGSALASDMIWEEVRKLSAKKPLVVSMGAVAASGGYYIAAPATKIMAEPTTITGSIGVIGAVPKGLKLAEKWGVHFHMVSGSDRRDYLNFGAKSSEEDKAILAESIRDTYDTFVQKVAAGRGQKAERIYQIAEGRVYTGTEALRLGLVDRLGGLHEALQWAKELAKLDPTRLYAIERYQPKPHNLLDCLATDAIWKCYQELQDMGLDLALPMANGMSMKPWERLQQLLHEDRVLAYWAPAHLLWPAPRIP